MRNAYLSSIIPSPKFGPSLRHCAVGTQVHFIGFVTGGDRDEVIGPTGFSVVIIAFLSQQTSYILQLFLQRIKLFIYLDNQL